MNDHLLSTSSTRTEEVTSNAHDAVLAAIGEIEFGTVEVIIHQGKIREIRQIRKKRFDSRSIVHAL